MREPPIIVPSLAAALRAARRVAVLTGAGVSAESGVPTFRDGQTGLWAKYDPRELATPEAFERNPKLVWDWYSARRATLADVAPNPAHFAIAELERRVPEFLLATQNVDGLHQRAGSKMLVELHGSIARVKCSRCAAPAARWDEALADEPPRCAGCGGFLRPDVVWFYELLPAAAQIAAEEAARQCDVFLVAGTSAEVYPAAELPEHALRAGARVVEINPHSTLLSERVTDVLRGPAGVMLPALAAAAFPT